MYVLGQAKVKISIVTGYKPEKFAIMVISEQSVRIDYILDYVRKVKGLHQFVNLNYYNLKKWLALENIPINFPIDDKILYYTKEVKKPKKMEYPLLACDRYSTHH